MMTFGASSSGSFELSRFWVTPAAAAICGPWAGPSAKATRIFSNRDERPDTFW